MASTVFILGAGASKQAGAPLMADFLDVAHDLWKTGQVNNYTKDFAAVFEGISALQRVHSKSQLDIQNIESVFAAFELAGILGRFGSYSPESIQGLSQSMVNVIWATLEQTIRFPASGPAVSAPQPYQEFVSLLGDLSGKAKPPQSIAIVTFNYDLAIDYALYKNSLRPLYGFDSKQGPGNVPLLKLHGSLNWARCDVCKEVVPWYLEEFFRNRSWNLWHDDDVKDVALNVSAHLENFSHCKGGKASGPVVVPPTWNKSEYHKSLSNVWARAAKELQDAENIIVIGYSLPQTDSFFRYLYALATVGETTLKRFWVFNPDTSGLVKDRFKDLLGPGAAQRYCYYPQTFADAITFLRQSLVKGA